MATLFWAFVLLGILVLAHELGHFLVAKATGVRVLRFSLGFGPRLLGLTIGDTDYRLSLVPFGGYVKLLGQESSEPLPQAVLSLDPNGPAYAAGVRVGDTAVRIGARTLGASSDIAEALKDLKGTELPFTFWREGDEKTISLPRETPFEAQPQGEDPFGRSGPVRIAELGMTLGDAPEELQDAFFCKPLWARFLVVLAGPLASLLFPLPLYFLYYLSVDQLPGTRIGQVLADSPAALAGLKPGDRVLAIDGKTTLYWPEMAGLIRENPEKTLDFEVERGAETIKLAIKPEGAASQNSLKESVQVGRIGILAVTSPAYVGVSGPQSPAFLAGLRSGDRIASINGKRVDFMWQLAETLRQAEKDGQTLSVVALRPKSQDSAPRWLAANLSPAQKPGGGYDSGLFSADVTVGVVREKGPAEKAGLKTGDRILRVDGRAISAWTELESHLREAREKPLTLEIERDGQPQSVSVTQEKEVLKSEYGEEITTYRFGAYSLLTPEKWLDGEFVTVNGSLGFAARGAASTLWDITSMEVRIFGLLFSGHVPFKTLGGPIMIFDVAGKAAEKGWQDYLWIMAMISINLGILNLLPVPVLDGGHLLFFTLEGIRRKPLNQRIKERAILAGFAALMLLMVFVMKNDLERYWERLFG